MGKVFLVGAGPGDPELLTVKAVRILRSADVVLHDALVSREVLDFVPPRAKVIDVGKRCGRKLLSQDEINSLLMFYAIDADVVVRLKGGDPLIFGRAGEEIEALVSAGTEVEIVPGITAAIAAAAVAGVSLTDRRFASSVIFTTAHRDASATDVQWERLVGSGSTIVIYMPGNDHAGLARELRVAGLAADTPCAVVSSASRPSQQILWTNLAALSRGNTLPAPSLVIVGHCARALPQLLVVVNRNLSTTDRGLNPSAVNSERSSNVR